MKNIGWGVYTFREDFGKTDKGYVLRIHLNMKEIMVKKVMSNVVSHNYYREEMFMKKKLILLSGLMALLIIEFIFFTLSAEMTGKRMFGIDESKYEVIKKDCTMSRIKEGGKIDIYLKVREEQIDEFIHDIECYGAYLAPIQHGYDIFIEGKMKMNPDEVERFYHGGRFARRKFISYLSPPSEINTWITISTCKGGYYDVRLWGWEIPNNFMNMRAWKLS